jgi:hypothetical protein
MEVAIMWLFTDLFIQYLCVVQDFLMCATMKRIKVGGSHGSESVIYGLDFDYPEDGGDTFI